MDLWKTLVVILVLTMLSGQGDFAHAEEALKQKVSDAALKSKEAVKGVFHKVKDKTHEVAPNVKDAAKKVKDKVKTKFHDIKKKMND